jgi:hypothetical protein
VSPSPSSGTSSNRNTAGKEAGLGSSSEASLPLLVVRLDDAPLMMPKRLLVLLLLILRTGVRKEVCACGAGPVLEEAGVMSMRNIELPSAGSGAGVDARSSDDPRARS